MTFPSSCTPASPQYSRTVACTGADPHHRVAVLQLSLLASGRLDRPSSSEECPSPTLVPRADRAQVRLQDALLLPRSAMPRGHAAPRVELRHFRDLVLRHLPHDVAH